MHLFSHSTLAVTALPQPKPQGVRIQALPSGKRPNFIVVLTDDQGYDDVGAHQPQQPGGKPQWVSTPNLDRFMQQSMEFRNFYVSPMCSQSRAELLTGRDYQRTGTMLINGGYDYINRAEATLGNVMADGVDAELDEQNYVLNAQLSQPIDYVMSNSFAFGGSNISLIFGTQLK